MAIANLLSSAGVAPPQTGAPTGIAGLISSAQGSNGTRASQGFGISALEGQGQVLRSTANYANSLPGMAMNAIKSIPSSYENEVAHIGTEAPAAFQAGAQEIKDNFFDVPGQNLAQRETGLEKLGEGAVGAIFSPAAPIFEPETKGISMTGNAIANSPAVQRFTTNTKIGRAVSSPTAAAIGQHVGRLSNIGLAVAGGLEGGEETPKTGISKLVDSAKDQAGEPVQETLPVTPKTTNSPVKTTPSSLEDMHDQYMASQGHPVEPTEPATTKPTVTETKPTESTPSTLRPAESTGEKTQSTLASKVDAKAVANKLSEGAEDLPEYNKVDWDSQGKFAADIVNADPVKAEAMLQGKEAMPPHVLATAVYTALENFATKTGDTDLIDRLSHESNTSLAATRMGQEIGYLSQRDSTSPVKIIKDVESGLGKSEPKSSLKVDPDEVKTSLKAARAPKETWKSFVDSISCNS